MLFLMKSDKFNCASKLGGNNLFFAAVLVELEIFLINKMKMFVTGGLLLLLADVSMGQSHHAARQLSVPGVDKIGVHVTGIHQFLNEDTSIDPGLNEIKISFDKPLSGKGWSISYGKMGKKHYPITDFLGYSDGNTSIRLQVALIPKFDYQFILTGKSFRTVDGRPIKPYKVHFKTGPRFFFDDQPW